jgi:uncharacterized small protein (DUF1192 family)
MSYNYMSAGGLEPEEIAAIDRMKQREHLYLLNIKKLEDEVAQLKGENQRLQAKLAKIDQKLHEAEAALEETSGVMPKSMRSEFY